MQTPKRTFLIVSLPRSRTAWLSCFFTVGHVFCHHDVSGRARSVEEIAGTILASPAPIAGSSDSGNILVLPRLRPLLGNPPILVVRRPVEECVESLAQVSRIDASNARLALNSMEAKLEALVNERSSDVLEIVMSQLDDETAMRGVWRHLVGDGFPFPVAHWRKMQTLHVELDPLILVQAAAGGVECATTDALKA